LRSLIARLRVVNRELREAEHKLDEICAVIGETGAASGVCLQRQDIIDSQINAWYWQDQPRCTAL